MSAFKRWLFPSREEQEASMKKREEVRQKNYDFQMKRLEFQEASAKRQKALADKVVAIRKLKGETQASKPRSPGIDFDAFFGPKGRQQPTDPLKALAEHEKKMNNQSERIDKKMGA